MGKQKTIPGFERVDVRLKIPKYKRDKLNILAAVEKTSVNNLLETLIDKALSESQELRALEQVKAQG